MTFPKSVLLILTLLVAGPSRAETIADATVEFDRFPFALEAGTYTDLTLDMDALRTRAVIPLVTVERPSDDLAVLRIAGAGGVRVDAVSTGTGSFRRMLDLEFGDEPLVLSRRAGRISLDGGLASLMMRLAEDPDPAFGTIAFEGMRYALSWPTRASERVQDVRLEMAFDRARPNPAMRAIISPGGDLEPEVGAADIDMRLDVVVLKDIATLLDTVGSRPPFLLRDIVLSRVDADLLGGRVEIAGEIEGFRDFETKPDAIDWTTTITKLSTMTDRLVKAELFTGQEVAQLSAFIEVFEGGDPDGEVTFRLETTPEQALLLNGTPAGSLAPETEKPSPPAAPAPEAGKNERPSALAAPVPQVERPVPKQPDPPPPSRAGDWRMAMENDPMTDRVSQEIVGIAGRFEGTPRAPMIRLHCRNGTEPIMSISWFAPLAVIAPRADQAHVAVAMRFGKRPARRLIWLPSQNRSVTYEMNDIAKTGFSITLPLLEAFRSDLRGVEHLWTARQLLRSLRRSDRLVIRAPTVAGTTITAIFDGTGFSELAARLPRACQ